MGCLRRCWSVRGVVCGTMLALSLFGTVRAEENCTALKRRAKQDYKNIVQAAGEFYLKPEYDQARAEVRLLAGQLGLLKKEELQKLRDAVQVYSSGYDEYLRKVKVGEFDSHLYNEKITRPLKRVDALLVEFWKSTQGKELFAENCADGELLEFDGGLSCGLKQLGPNGEALRKSIYVNASGWYPDIKAHGIESCVSFRNAVYGPDLGFDLRVCAGWDVIGDKPMDYEEYFVFHKDGSGSGGKRSRSGNSISVPADSSYENFNHQLKSVCR